ncbi:MAG: cupin domain-containing protein [Erythrobacter sp.]
MPTGCAKSVMRNKDFENRVVRYRDLVPCYNAFVDTRTPGSEAKENFTIIGPGVSENPEQFVHIKEPHGFNVGGARQPPGCVNSQHSHKTAEVFVVHTGTWRFDFGEDGDDAQVVLEEGDVVSIPTNVFRGFTNVGDDIGYLYAVLGQDNPGHVTWASAVFELAKDHGLVLLESGMLVDTTRGETIPQGAAVMSPPGREELASMGRVTPDQAEEYVWRELAESPKSIELIGPKGIYPWDHGFNLRRDILVKGETLERPAPDAPEVIFVHRGSVCISSADRQLELGEGDTFSAPQEVAYDIEATDDTIAFITTRAD